MSLKVEYCVECNFRSLAEFQKNPKFRKATPLGVMMVNLLNQISDEIDKNWLENTAIVYCSDGGELVKTIEFLDTYFQEKMARPFLFQNSLHSSTIGFLTQWLKFNQAAMTLSYSASQAEEAKEVIGILLKSAFCRRVLFLNGDFYDTTRYESKELQSNDWVDFARAELISWES